MKKIILSLGIFIFALGLLGAGMLTVRGYACYKDALGKKSLADMADEIRTNPAFTSFDEMPEVYKDAVIAVEDKRFYSHSGFDVIAIGRAVWHDILAGSFVEGGSTITQQLAKNQYFTQDKDITRKIAEIFMAIDIEKAFTKEEIFELYVNSIYFGDGYYSVADASQGYFGKTPADMTMEEATMLAGIPNAPSVYAPTVNPELASQRQKQVITQMIKCGFLTEDTVVSLQILPAISGISIHENPFGAAYAA